MPEPLTDPPPQATVELGLLTALASEEDLAALQRTGLRPADFIVLGPVYGFILDYRRDYGKLPTAAQVLREAGDGWEPPGGEFRYWLDEMARYTLTRRAQVVIRDGLPGLERDPQGTVRSMVAELTSIGLGTAEHVQATDTAITERVERYAYRAVEYERTGGQMVWGIRTGLHVIDSSHIGWQPGELIGLYARPSVGKTWFLLRLGVEAWRYADNRVLLISPEMPAGQVALRVDTLIAGAMGLPMSHRKLYAGNPDVRAAYGTLADAVKRHERWWTVDSIDGRAIALSDIASLHRQFKPTLILVDGISLLRDEENAKAGWERMHNLCYGLKNLCTAYGVAAIINNQAVNTRRGRRGETDVALGRGDDWIMPSLNDAAYGDSFVQACSTVITMCPDPEEHRLRWYSVRKSRERDLAWFSRLALAWDPDRGRITDLSYLGNDDARIKQEVARTVA